MAERKADTIPFANVFSRPPTFGEAPILQGLLALFAFRRSLTSATIPIRCMDI
jgi:hypothetical protein